ncbi:MAG: efflux RND transporter periplasmic adaptor subunit [Chitinophagaceae bacterium]
MKFQIIIGCIALCASLSACSNKKDLADASGSFEAEETVISAEANGILKQFNIEEGQTIPAGQYIGYIDSTQLFLKKKQLEAQAGAVLVRRPNISTQLAALKTQLSAAQTEQKRVQNLYKSGAATGKQQDDVNAQVAVLKKQIEAQQSSLDIASSGISSEATPLQIQVAQIQDQLDKSRITNPIKGTVLTKYAEANEMVAIGKPLYKIADLNTINLRAYITGNQLPNAKLNQSVKVLTDNGKGGFKETSGTITWISDKAEFTPKTIQTKDERANLVYAIKVLVNNPNGDYKIGMYGELKF